MNYRIKVLIHLTLLSQVITSCDRSNSKNNSGVMLKNKTIKSNYTIEANKILNIKNNMKGYHINIEKETIKNTNFRKVLYTATNMQLVLMCLKPNEEIGMETHKKVDQFFRIESGFGKCIINDVEQEITNGDVIIVPAGAKHNIVNTNKSLALKLYTIYSPPNYEDAIVRETKKDADEKIEKYEGINTEQ